MNMIDSSNAKEHSYPVYGRQFISYKWYKPVLVFILFTLFYLILSVALVIGVAVFLGNGSINGSVSETASGVFSQSYDDMDLANAWQSVVNLGSVAVMIPALWLAANIVRDRPFSSYSSARGGWNGKVFWKSLLVSVICLAVPMIIKDLFVEHRINDFDMKFTLTSFAVVTILGPLQCIGEEYAFRGLLMQTFGSWFKVPVIAVIIQALVFMSMHPYDTVGKIGIIASGLVFAFTAWIGRGIEVSSAYHVVNNMTISYLQGMNLTEISSSTTVKDLIFELCTGALYVLVIFIISKKTDWFSKIKREDAAEWNQRIEDKIARKEAKAEAKAEKKAAKEGPVGAHDESAPGKHFKN